MSKTAITCRQFRETIEKGKLGPVCLAIGNEPLLLDEVETAAHELLVEESTRDFNLDLFHGDDLDLQRLASALGALPMMAERRVIIVKRAESLTSSVQNYLIEYVRNPVPSSVLILLLQSDAKKKWVDKLAEQSKVIRCDTPRGKEREKWIRAKVDELGATIDDDALDLISEGRNIRLIEIAGELEKAVLLAGENGRVSREVVQRVWGIEPEVNIWSFFDRVASGQRCEALRDLNRLQASLDRDRGAGFILAQVGKRLRLAIKEREYDSKHVPSAKRTWSGNTRRQWNMASDELKSLPQKVAEKALERLLQLDRERKTRAFDTFRLIERLIHRVALDREESAR